MVQKQTRPDETERATGLDRRTKEESQKSGIILTSLRFQTWGRHHKVSGLPSEEHAANERTGLVSQKEKKVRHTT